MLTDDLQGGRVKRLFSQMIKCSFFFDTTVDMENTIAIVDQSVDNLIWQIYVECYTDFCDVYSIAMHYVLHNSMNATGRDRNITRRHFVL